MFMRVQAGLIIECLLQHLVVLRLLDKTTPLSIHSTVISISYRLCRRIGHWRWVERCRSRSLSGLGILRKIRRSRLLCGNAYTFSSGGEVEDLVSRMVDPSPIPLLGGAGAFLDFLTSELMPTLSNRYPIDAENAIYGRPSHAASESAKPGCSIEI